MIHAAIVLFFARPCTINRIQFYFADICWFGVGRSVDWLVQTEWVCCLLASLHWTQPTSPVEWASRQLGAEHFDVNTMWIDRKWFAAVRRAHHSSPYFVSLSLSLSFNYRHITNCNWSDWCDAFLFSSSTILISEEDWTASVIVCEWSLAVIALRGCVVSQSRHRHPHHSLAGCGGWMSGGRCIDVFSCNMAMMGTKTEVSKHSVGPRGWRRSSD